MTKPPLRVAVLTNRLPPYRVPAFSALGGKQAVQLKFFLSLPVEQSSLRARNELELHYSKGIRVGLRTHGLADSFQIPILLVKDLLKFKPNLVISGDYGLPSFVGWLIARLCRSQFVIWSEEIEDTAQPITGAQRLLRRFLIPRTRAFLAWGQPACDYLSGKGVHPKDIYYCAQAVENDFWMRRSIAVDRKVLRAELGFSGTVFLAVSRLIAPKAPDLLIDAWLAVPSEVRQGNRLVIVGEGELMPLLQQKVASSGVSEVELIGFKPSEELWKYYTAADYFVFPSVVDVWGLVVNEALACGLRVLASRYAGATQELVNITDQIEPFDPLDKPAFVSMLTRCMTASLVHDPDTCRAAIGLIHSGTTATSIERLISDLCPGTDTVENMTGRLPI